MRLSTIEWCRLLLNTICCCSDCSLRMHKSKIQPRGSANRAIALKCICSPIANALYQTSINLKKKNTEISETIIPDNNSIDQQVCNSNSKDWYMKRYYMWIVLAQFKSVHWFNLIVLSPILKRWPHFRFTTTMRTKSNQIKLYNLFDTICKTSWSSRFFFFC